MCYTISMTPITFHCDGGSRGNPGPSSCGVYFDGTNQGIGMYAGDYRTNNEAEALALLMGLDYATEHGHTDVVVFSDSKLIVNQTNGVWAVKAPTMLPLMDRIHNSIFYLRSFQITYVPRANNTQADYICNEILDLAEKGNKLTCPTSIEIL